jgi:four helix bundle protein
MGKTHKDLAIWRLGTELAAHVHQAIRTFPKDEEYGLKSQMRRAAVSYPSNVAEGAARFSRREYVHFLYIAHVRCPSWKHSCSQQRDSHI